MITIFFWFFIFNLNKLLCNATKNIVAKVVLDYAEFCSQGLFNNLCATQQKKKNLLSLYFWLTFSQNDWTT